MPTGPQWNSTGSPRAPHRPHFAAGNFLYIAATDLVPEITSSPTAGEKAVLSTGFAAGLLLLYVVAVVA